MKTKFFNIDKNTKQTNNNKLAIKLISSAVIISTFLAGCAKNIPTDGIYIDTYSLGDKIEIEVENDKSFEIKNPIKDCEIKISTVPEDMKAEISDGKLNVSSQKIGEKELEVTLEAQGYKDTDAKLVFDVVAHKLELNILELANIDDVNSAKEIADNTVFIPRGSKKAILLKSNANANYTVKCDNDKVSATVSNGILTLSSNEVCEANVTVKGYLENHTEAEKSFKVKVTPTKTSISVSEDEITIDLNKKHIITLDYDEKTAIEIGYSSELLNVARLDNKLSVTALKSGKGKITVTAQKDGYLETTKQISVTVPYPLVGIGLDKYDLKLKQGETSEVAVTTDPTDALIEANVISGNATCTVKNKVIHVTGGSEKSQIKIIAQRNNYDPSYIVLNVDVNNEAEKPKEVLKTVEVPSNKTVKEIIKLTNEFREENGVPALRYVSEVDEPAKIRAEEASELWSHTRPDGTKYNTVFKECGLEKYNQNGENLFMATYTPTAKEIVDAWIASPGHRENLLREQFTGLSIGIYKASNGEYFCSQLFIVD